MYTYLSSRTWSFDQDLHLLKSKLTCFLLKYRQFNESQRVGGWGGGGLPVQQPLQLTEQRRWSLYVHS